jgi:hypothetical protein
MALYSRPMAAASLPEPIYVIASTLEGTGNALAVAIPLARNRHAPLTVAVAQVIPAGGPPVLSSRETESVATRYRTLLLDLRGVAEIDVCPCQSISDILTRVPPDATIVIAGAVAWPLVTPEETMAIQLRQIGRHVVFVPSVT